jgi:transketolase
MVKSIANSYSHVITLEEHQLNCGFGSTLLETLNDLLMLNEISLFPKVSRLGINNQFIGYAGSQDFLREQSGLNLDVIFNRQ